MKILVTGGAGYIGSVTARVLLDAGHEVVVLDTLERGNREAVDPRAEFVESCVCDAEKVEPVLASGIDAVMHLAGMIDVAESLRDPARYFDHNLSRPLRLLDAMTRQGVRDIVFSSTAAVYGEPASIPIGEDAATVPVNPYGATKLMFEQALDWYDRCHGVRSIRFRYFNVAGAWPDGSMGEAHHVETHLVPKVLQAMAGGERRFEVFGGDYPTHDGTCVRDYIHVADLAEAHLLGLERLGAGGKGGVFNLGNGRGYTNLEVVRTCAEVTGADVEVTVGPRRSGDPAVLVASSERARTELGWRSDGSLRDMVADAWRWHVSHPEGYAPAR